jgi:uncharacterized membrane protein YadS
MTLKFEFVKDLVDHHFDKLYLFFIFAFCVLTIFLAYLLIPASATEIVDYVKNSFVLGAIVGLVTGVGMAKRANGNGHPEPLPQPQQPQPLQPAKEN